MAQTNAKSGLILDVKPAPGASTTTSLWDGKENADVYSRDGYASVLKSLAKVIEGTPTVHTYEVANSTFHKIAAAVAA